MQTQTLSSKSAWHLVKFPIHDNVSWMEQRTNDICCFLQCESQFIYDHDHAILLVITDFSVLYLNWCYMYPLVKYIFYISYYIFQAACTDPSFVIISITRLQATFIPLTRWWKLQPLAPTQVDGHETLAILATTVIRCMATLWHIDFPPFRWFERLRKIHKDTYH
jgi:hypothetical protein